MRKRTKSREVAIQALYQLDLTKNSYLPGLDSFFNEQDVTPDVLEFAIELVKGCISVEEEINEKIAAVSKHWELGRMPAVDRGILRLCVYELLYRDDIPPKVSINEAVDLAKKFSTEDSGSFVNGVLDKVYSKYKTLITQKRGEIDPQ